MSIKNYNFKKLYLIITILLFCLIFSCYADNKEFKPTYIEATIISDNHIEAKNIFDYDLSYFGVPLPIATSSELDSLSEKIFIHDGVKYKKGASLGNFSLSGYCACTKCSTGTGITYSGKQVRENHTVGADLNIVPLGTMIIIEGTEGRDVERYNGIYQVEDTGGGIKGKKHIDIYQPTHDYAALVTYYGRAYANIYLAEPVE